MKILKRYRPYEERFIMFSNFFEKLLVRLLVLLLVALIMSQLLLSFDDIRHFLVPVERIEGSN